MPLRKSFFCRKLSTAASSSSFGELGTLHTEKETKIEQTEAQDGDEDTKDRIDSWSTILPELLSEIIHRVDSSEDQWPIRKNVVACAGVCKKWREITRGIVESPEHSGRITFPSSLKQPGTRDLPIQCFIKRNKKTSTFGLYLGLSKTFTDTGKFLLAAQRFGRAARTGYIISLNADDIAQGSNAYMGKLSSDFLGTAFTIYDSQPPYSGAKLSSSRAGRRFASKQICPQAPAGNFEIGQVSYKLEFWRKKGPRRMLCTFQCPLKRAPINEPQKNSDTQIKTTLRNKSPTWHEHLLCWYLNFHGRVTVASIKNFQLIAAGDPSRPCRRGDDDMVLLQFGKVGDDMFTMDYRWPLSAFQAFAICLTSFG